MNKDKQKEKLLYIRMIGREITDIMRREWPADRAAQIDQARQFVKFHTLYTTKAIRYISRVEHAEERKRAHREFCAFVESCNSYEDFVVAKAAEWLGLDLQVALHVLELGL